MLTAKTNIPLDFTRAFPVNVTWEGRYKIYLTVTPGGIERVGEPAGRRVNAPGGKLRKPWENAQSSRA